MPSGIDFLNAIDPYIHPSLPAPAPAEEALGPAHPYPGWMSPRRPGSTAHAALMPYVDLDLHEGGSAEGKEGSRSQEALLGGMSAVGNTKLGAESWIERNMQVTRAGREAEHTARGVEHGASGAARALKLATGFLHSFDVFGGAMELVEGIDMFRGGQKLEGGYKGVEGLAGIGSGFTGLLSLGFEGLSPISAALAGGEQGLAIGRYGDEKVRELGWFQDSDGEDLSASELAGHTGAAADRWVTKHLNGSVGSIAGVGTTALMLGPSATVAAAGAAVGKGHELGTGWANHHRANHYEDLGMSANDAHGMADYEDERDAHLEALRRQRERNRPTYGQWFDRALEKKR